MGGKTVSLFKNKYVKLGLCFVFFLAAGMIVLSMLLGNEAGQFVIRVQSGNVEKSIGITENLEDTNPGSKLQATGMDNMTDYSPKYFLQEDYVTLRALSEKGGYTNYDQNALYIYTFYIKNTSKSGGVGVNVKMTYSHVSNYLDEIVRVLTFYETYNVSDPRIYQKADDLPKLQAKFPELTSINYDAYDVIDPEPFLGDGRTVFSDQTINIGFNPGEDYVKYTVMIWLEGDDPDSEYYDTLLYNGTIKFELDIAIAM